MSDELKPCPSCGRIEPLFETRERERDMYGDRVYRVRCTDLACVCSRTRWYHNEAGALREWNRRPNNWIPVSERLPNYGRWVLAQMNNTESSMIVASRDEDGTWIDLDERGLIHRVIAWMPLPEPYTESESSDE